MYPKSIFTFTLIFVFILLSQFSFSQIKKINGQVMLHNSKSEKGKIQFVEDVKIKPITSNYEVYSDRKGQFKFKLKGKFEGEPVLIQVEKDGYEVVDYRDVHYFLIDKKPRLRIFLAEQGYVRNVSKSLAILGSQSISNEKDELLELIAFGGAATTDAVKKIEIKLGRNITNAHEAELLIPKLAEDIEGLVRLHSHELAVVNPDYSSDKYQMALSAYRSGSHERALGKLQKENVDKEVEKWYAEVDKLEKQPSRIDALISKNDQRIDQIKNNYIFQAVILQQTFRLKEASVVIEKLNKLNHLSPTQKCFDLIKRLDFFDVNEIIQDNQPIVSDIQPISHNAKKNRGQNQIENQKLKTLQNQEKALQQNNIPLKFPSPYVLNDTATKTKIGSKSKLANNKVVEKTTLSSDENKNIDYQINSNTSKNQETTITITTTITTSANGENHVKTVTKKSNSPNELTTPTNYNYNTQEEKTNTTTDVLSQKGDPVLNIENATFLDFENVLLSSKTLNAHFKYFIENGKKVRKEVE